MKPRNCVDTANGRNYCSIKGCSEYHIWIERYSHPYDMLKCHSHPTSTASLFRTLPDIEYVAIIYPRSILRGSWMYSLTCADGLDLLEKGLAGEFYLDQERCGLPSVNETMIVGECDIHHLQWLEVRRNVKRRGLILLVGFRSSRQWERHDWRLHGDQAQLRDTILAILSSSLWIFIYRPVGGWWLEST